MGLYDRLATLPHVHLPALFMLRLIASDVLLPHLKQPCPYSYARCVSLLHAVAKLECAISTSREAAWRRDSACPGFDGLSTAESN